MTRKTYPVENLIEKANRMIERGDTPEGREAVALMLESVLHETGNYHGFRFLPSEYARDGEPTETPLSPLRAGFDMTRRSYYYR